MKNKLLLLAIFTSIILIFSACGGGDQATDDSLTDETETTESTESTLAYEPEDVKDTDVCEVCAMAVPNNEHATQIVLTNERSIKFDDIGCMFKWINENGEDEIGTAFVRDYNSQEWFDLNEATFVYHEEIETPMAYGVISFINESDADAFVEEFGKGDILKRNDLNNHEWKMNKEMMGHGHDHDHEHEDHDHE